MTEEEYKRLQFIVETLVSTNELRERIAKKILEEAKKTTKKRRKN